ncbi:hypothetical protein ACOSQ2_021609 [Xanthoceras sorbifolium]
MNEFYRLVQGSMTVDAYEKKFTELSRAAPHIVENEVNRCRKFEKGLRHEIKTYVSTTEHTEYGKLVESALRVERNINAAHRFDQQRQKCSNQNWSLGDSNSKLPIAENYSRPTTSFQQKYVPDSSQASVKQLVGGSPPSHKCGKNHKGQCNLGIPGCYHCGQTGHFKRDCPGLVHRSNVEQFQVPRNASCGIVQMQAPRAFQKSGSTVASRTRNNVTEASSNPQRNQSGRPQTQARVFALTQQDVEASSDVVTGMLNIFDHNAHIFIDPGSTHSFVSCSFAVYLNKELKPLDCNMVVATPTGSLC